MLGVDADAPSGLQALVSAGVELHLREQGVELLDRVRTIVKSPGVPAQAPVIAQARSREMDVIGELELAWRLLPNEFIAVTGTNGKTTTVELIGHIHREAGLGVAVAGNVGVALSGLDGRIDASAYRRMRGVLLSAGGHARVRPRGGACCSTSRPTTSTGTGRSRPTWPPSLRSSRDRTPEDVAVAPFGFLPEGLPGRARRVSFGSDPHAQLSERDGTLHWQGQPLLAASELSLRGRHNLENAMAAAAVCLARGLDVEAVRAGLRSFAGVPHRLEQVARRDGVLFVNDSKATNVASTLVALEAMAAQRLPVHLILGGQGKAQDFTALRAPVSAGCRAVYLIGEDASAIEQALGGADIEVHMCGDLDHALALAARRRVRGEVVLLSPGCASFDQFADFEARGERFRELVQGA